MVGYFFLCRNLKCLCRLFLYVYTIRDHASGLKHFNYYPLLLSPQKAYKAHSLHFAHQTSFLFPEHTNFCPIPRPLCQLHHLASFTTPVPPVLYLQNTKQAEPLAYTLSLKGPGPSFSTSLRLILPAETPGPYLGYKGCHHCTNATQGAAGPHPQSSHRRRVDLRGGSTRS